MVCDTGVCKATGVTNELCSQEVQGAVVRDSSSWVDFMGYETTHCKCPDNAVISGEADICKQKDASYEQYFDLESDVKGQGCTCTLKFQDVTLDANWGNLTLSKGFTSGVGWQWILIVPMAALSHIGGN